jgi:hypothetical protein
MRVFLMVVAGVVGLIAVSFAFGVGVWQGVGGLALVGGAVFWLGHCSHPAPLALLPATIDLNGVPVPARWYCDHCRREWPAVFEKTQTPIQRFTGYDQTKAVSAARRAGALQDHQRAMALERAGLSRAGGPGSIRSPRRAGVVPISARRSLAR